MQKKTTPVLQKIVYYIASLVGGYLFLGAFTDAISNVNSLVTIDVALYITFFFFLIILVANILIRNRLVRWSLEYKTIVTIKKIGAYIYAPIIGILLGIWLPLVIKDNTNDRGSFQMKKSQPQIKIKCQFPENPVDTLFILVTRFEDYINKTETTCFGKALRDKIEVNAVTDSIAIKVCYDDKLCPQTIEEAEKIQKQTFADIVLYGRLKDVEYDCAPSYFCFRSQPSDNLIKIAGGTKLKNVELNYERNKIGPDDIEKGNFHVDSKIFDSWLYALYNIKIGKPNPSLYIIDKNLPIKERANQYYQRSLLFYNLRNFKKCIEDLDNVVKLNNKFFKDKKDILIRGAAYNINTSGKTVMGDNYNPEYLTAAHNYLPLGTIVLLKNIRNKKSVFVLINDRGPFNRTREMDISQRAATNLGLKNNKTESLQMKVITDSYFYR